MITPSPTANAQDAIEAGTVVLEGRGDGTYAEAEQAIRWLIARIALLEELREALEPFARTADDLPKYGVDSYRFFAGKLTNDDLRRARAAIAKATAA